MRQSLEKILQNPDGVLRPVYSSMDCNSDGQPPLRTNTLRHQPGWAEEAAWAGGFGPDEDVEPVRSSSYASAAPEADALSN